MNTFSEEMEFGILLNSCCILRNKISHPFFFFSGVSKKIRYKNTNTFHKSLNLASRVAAMQLLSSEKGSKIFSTFSFTS